MVNATQTEITTEVVEAPQETVKELPSKPVVGIIYPPPDIRNIVDKTAVFVARNGVQFEERIRENEKHNAKFSFLNPNDPYHAYYQYKIAETKEGKVTTKKREAKEEKEKKEEVLVQKAPPKEPPPFEFMTEMPAISAQDLDILKLTAQFVARNGRQFMTALSQREQRNYQFDFLRPNHSLFNYFTKLVEQYTKVLIPPKNLSERLKVNVDNKYEILDRVMQRVEYAAYQEEERKKAEEKEDQERIAYASIDWHDFVIVETVEFTEADETIDLPPPMSIMELENMTLAQKKMASVMLDAQVEDKGIEEDMEMDEDVEMEEEEEDQIGKKDESLEPELEAEPAVMEIKPPDATAPIKIRKDYVPKVHAPKTSGTRPLGICPRCNQAIPVDEMEEHMRIELLDPKWKEQKEAADAKKKESNLLREGTDVAKILKNFSGYRSDIFGTEETEIGRKIGEAEEKRKRIEKEKVVWDGHTASINMATQRAAAGVSIDEQIAAIHRSKGLTSDGDSKIGPRIPQAQDSPHQQQAHMAASQFQNLQNQHQMYGFPPVPHNQVYSPYVPSSAPFAHQLSGYITSAHPHANMAMGHHHMLQRPHMQSTHRPPQPPGMPPVMMSHVQGQSPIPASGIPGAPIPYAASMSLDKEKGRLAEEDLDPTNPAKKQKLDGNIPAGTGFMNDDNMSGHQTFFTLTIQCPNLPEKPEWNCTGQSLEIEDVSLNMLVSTLKDKIAARLSFPAGKQKLAIGGQVMKNQGALGFYNIENGTAISLQVKDRGKK